MATNFNARNRGFLTLNPSTHSSNLFSNNNTPKASLNRLVDSPQHPAGLRSRPSNPLEFVLDPPPVIQASPRRELVPWGVSDNDTMYHTSYSHAFDTPDKKRSTSRTRESCSPAHRQNLSMTLIPFNGMEVRKGKSSGDYHPNNLKRALTEEDTFFDKIGEVNQAVTIQGRAWIEEPKIQDPAYKKEFRYYGESPKHISANKMIKQIFDFSPSLDMASGRTTVPRNHETLAFPSHVDDVHEKLVKKLDGGYSSIERKFKGEKSQGKRMYNSNNTRDNNMKDIMAHVDLYKRDTGEEVSRKKEDLRTVKIWPEKSIDTFKSNFLKQAKASEQLQYGLRSTRELRTQGDKDRESFFSEQRTNSNQNRLTRNKSGGTYCSTSRDVSRSNSATSSNKSLPRQASARGFNSLVKDKSQDKNSFIVVSHEKKKPILGGSYGNPSFLKDQKKNVTGATSQKTRFNQAK